MILMFLSLVLLICSIAFFINSHRFRGKDRITSKLIAAVIFIFGLGILGGSSISSVPAGHTGILTTFGKVEDASLPNGVNFHLPWQTVITMSNKEQTFTETNSAFSRDLQEVEYTYTVKYSLSVASTPEIYRNVGTNYFSILIKPQVNNAIKAQFGSCKAEEMTENRNAIQSAINDALQDYANSYGITIQVFLDNFDFTDVYTNAVEAKQVAEQDALRNKTQQAMLTEQARAEAERARIEAENAAEIARINAEADLEVQKINADAAEYAGQKEAAANKAISNSLTPELIQYQYAIRWDGVLPGVMSENVIPFLNMEEQ